MEDGEENVDVKKLMQRVEDLERSTRLSVMCVRFPMIPCGMKADASACAC
jgi:hypothetical protein